MFRKTLLLLALLIAPAAFAQTCVPINGITCSPNLNLNLAPFNYKLWNVPTNANWLAIDTLSLDLPRLDTANTFTFPITAPSFNGDLHGNADTATSSTTSTTSGTATHALNLPSDFAAQSLAGPSSASFTDVIAGSSLSSPSIKITGQSISTSPVCPNGPGGQLTISGCAGGASGGVSGQAIGVFGLPTGPTVIGAQSHLDDGVTKAATITSTEPMVLPSSQTSLTPVNDIRAYGATIGGGDIGSALASAQAAACQNSGVVYLPCAANGSGSFCVLANASSIGTQSGTGRGSACTVNNQPHIQYKLQGNLFVQSTFVMPGETSLVCDGGSVGGQFTSNGPTCGIIVADVDGKLGTGVSAGSQTFTPTFTHGSIANLPVNGAITIEDDVTCNISTITRTAASGVGNVTATLSGPCHIPPAVTITVAGVTGDTSFNYTPLVLTSDFGTNTMTWTQAGAVDSGTPSTGTITGMNKDLYESVYITAASGGNLTAFFAHAHASTANWGIVAVSFMPGVYNDRSIHGLRISGNDGMGLYIPISGNFFLDGLGVGATARAASGTVEIDGAYAWEISHSSFTTTAPGATSCGIGGVSCGQQSYPYALRLTSDVQGNAQSASGIVDANTTIMGGIQMDSNGLAGSAGALGGSSLKDLIIEQAAGPAITIDPPDLTTVVNTPWTVENVFIQDAFKGYPIQLIGYTSPNLGGRGGINVGPLHGSNLSALTNSYYNGTVLVNGVDRYNGIPSIPNSYAHTGTFNDGITTEAEFRGEGANFAPAIMPFASSNVTINPAAWGCTGTGCSVVAGIFAPDGSTTAGELITGSSNSATINVFQENRSVQPGDWIITGVWTEPGTGNSIPYPGYTVLSTDTSSGFNGTTNHQYISSFNSAYSNDWWHPIVDATEQTGIGSGSHTIQMNLTSGLSSGLGVRFWNPFYIYIPISLKPSTMTTGQWNQEIARIRQWLLHGNVMPNAIAGKLNSAYPIVLPVDPLAARQASTKAYVDLLPAPTSTGGISITDRFARANGSLGANWTQSTGTALIQSVENVGNISTSTSDLVWYSGQQWAPNHCSQFTVNTIPQTSNALGLIVRTQDASNYYLTQSINSNGSNSLIGIYKVVAGVATQLGAFGSTTPTMTVGDTFAFCATGGATTTLTAYRNGASVLVRTDASGPFLNGYPGFEMIANSPANALRIGNWIGSADGINVGTVLAQTLNVVTARKGTFVCTGGGTITITNANYVATSDVIITMNTAGGTITTSPAMKTVTPATGFTVLCGATDTSTYNYSILN